MKFCYLQGFVFTNNTGTLLTTTTINLTHLIFLDLHFWHLVIDFLCCHMSIPGIAFNFCYEVLQSLLSICCFDQQCLRWLMLCQSPGIRTIGMNDQSPSSSLSIHIAHIKKPFFFFIEGH